MNQLALGDASAVVSLKAVIPDREPASGLLNYGPEPEEREKWTDEQKRKEEQRETAKLKVAAQDPLLRRLVTVHILATAVSPDYYYTEGLKKAGVNRSARWFNIIQQANLSRIEDAEYLGWISYNEGDYKGAAHWLELSKGDSAAALWLKAKLQLRAGKFADATKYLSPPYDKVLEKYVKALKDGANEKLSKTERAHAWFTAAWLARYDGMELMGTEGAPDAFAEGGEFEMPDLAKERRSGAYQTVAYDKERNASYDENGNPKMKSVPAILKASAKEIQRLNTNKITPDIRFHYRLIAGALAMKAAALLPDNSEELADVVNQAGMWVKDRDEKVGNRYYEVIDHRCAKTKIGQADIAKHWFVDQEGPWSTAQQQANEAMHKELKMDNTE